MKKKRSNGEGSFRKRSNGRWEVRFTLGLDPETRKPIQKSLSAGTKRECKARMEQVLAENRGVQIRHSGDYTVAEWCRLWFETYTKPNISYNTARCYQNVIEHHIIPAIGSIPLNLLGSEAIQQMYNDTRNKHQVVPNSRTEGPRLTGSFVRRIHMILHSALQQAMLEGLIPYNPCHICHIPPKEKQEKIIVPPEQIGRFLNAAEECGMLPFFYLELTSGLRRGEIIALHWDDLDREKRALSVSKQVTRTEKQCVVTEPKTQNSVRQVVISQQTIELLAQEHDRHPDNPILFPSPRTKRYWSPDAITRLSKRLLKRAEIDERVSFHDLRHTFATLAIQNGVDPKTLSSMLGHYSAAFTLDTYTHVTHQMQRAAAEKIGDLMEETMVPVPEASASDNRDRIIVFQRR